MAENVAASMTATIVIDKKEAIASALSAYASAQKELDNNKLEILIDVSDQTAIKKIKEVQKLLKGKDYTLKFQEQGIERIEKSLNGLLEYIQKINSNKNVKFGNSMIDEKSLQKAMDLFEKVESHLNTLKKTISDVGDGEEFSPLLSTIKGVENAVGKLNETFSKIKLNINFELNGNDEQSLAKIEKKKQDLLAVYRNQFEAMKNTRPSGKDLAKSMISGGSNDFVKALQKEILLFNELDFDNIDQKIGAYEKIIEKMKQVSAESYGTNIFKDIDPSFKNKVSAAKGALTKAQNEIGKGSSDGFSDLFGKTDLTQITSQLGQVVDRLEQIATVGLEIRDNFSNGIDIKSSLNEVETLKKQVEELQTALNKTAVKSAVENPANSSGSSEKIITEAKNVSENVTQVATQTAQAVSQASSSAETSIDETIKKIEQASSSVSEYLNKVQHLYPETLLENRDIISQSGLKGTYIKKDEKGNEHEVGSFSFLERLQDGQVQKVLVRYDEETQAWYETVKNVSTAFEQVGNKILKLDEKIQKETLAMEKQKSLHPNYDTSGDEKSISLLETRRSELEEILKLYSDEEEYVYKINEFEEKRLKNQEALNVAKEKANNMLSTKQQEGSEKGITKVGKYLNGQQIDLDKITRTYDKIKNPDLDKSVTKTSDLIELRQKKQEIQQLINSLSGTERTSQNESEFLKLDRLIAEYRELAKYKLEANNPKQQKLGGENLTVFLSQQNSEYDALIAKAKLYGKATEEIVKTLEKQKSIISQTNDKDQYTASAEDARKARDILKVQKSALNSIRVDDSVRKQEQETNDAIKENITKINQLKESEKSFTGRSEVSTSLQTLETNIANLNKQLTNGKIEINDYKAKIKGLFSEFKTGQTDEYKKLIDYVNKYTKALKDSYTATSEEEKNKQLEIAREYKNKYKDARANMQTSGFSQNEEKELEIAEKLLETKKQIEVIQTKTTSRQKTKDDTALEEQAYKDLANAISRYETIQKRIASGESYATDVKELQELQSLIQKVFYSGADSNTSILSEKHLNDLDNRLQNILKTISDIQTKTTSRQKTKDDYFNPLYDTYKGLATLNLTERGNQVLDSSVTLGLEKGLIKVTAQIKNAQGVWQEFTATMNRDADMFDEKFKPITKGTDKLNARLNNRDLDDYKKILNECADIQTEINRLTTKQLQGQDVSADIDKQISKLNQLQDAAYKAILVMRELYDAENKDPSYIVEWNKNFDLINKATNGSTESVQNLNSAKINAYKNILNEYANAQTELNRLKTKQVQGQNVSDDIENQISKLNRLQDVADKAALGLLELYDAENKDSSYITEWSKNFDLISKAANGSAESIQNLNKASASLKTNVEKEINSANDLLAKVKFTPPEGERKDTYNSTVSQLEVALNNLKQAQQAVFNSPGAVSEEQYQNIAKYRNELVEATKAVKNLKASEKGASLISRKKLENQINEYVNKNSGMSKDFKNQFQAILNEMDFKGANSNVADLTTKFLNLKIAVRNAGQEGRSFLDTIKDKAWYGLAGQLGMYFNLYSAINKARSAITMVIQLDDAIVDLKKTTAMSSAQLNQFYADANPVARQMGVTTQEIIEQASAWSRLGYNTQEAATQMAKMSSKFASISPGMSTEDAQSGLVSIMKAWDIDTDQVESKIMDKVNILGKKLPKHTVMYGVD